MRKIHWFSPLPPAKTDIGNYTARLLDALRSQAEVVLWTPTPSDQVSVSGAVRPLMLAGTAVEELNAASAIFYNLGNHGPFHCEILKQSWTVPGIVIAHEADLHGLLAYAWVEHLRRPDLYLREMSITYGKSGLKAAEARLRGEDVSNELQSMPLFSAALRNCIGAVCHSHSAAAELRKNDIPYFQLDLPFGKTRLERKSHRTGPIRIVQFGFLNPHRRTLAMLELLAAWEQRSKIRLDIYGSLWDQPLVEAKIRQLCLQDVVKIHGYVSEDLLNDRLSAADLVLNLRYPTIGEASGSQMRIWNASVPSLVTNIGWFKDLPEKTVIKIDHSQETAQVREILERLVRDRYCLDDIGRKGHEVLKMRHSPDEYVRNLILASLEVGALRRRAGSLAVLETATIGFCEMDSKYSFATAFSDCRHRLARVFA